MAARKERKVQKKEPILDDDNEREEKRMPPPPSIAVAGVAPPRDGKKRRVCLSIPASYRYLSSCLMNGYIRDRLSMIMIMM
jgi:hypothetical protein